MFKMKKLLVICAILVTISIFSVTVIAGTVIAAKEGMDTAIAYEKALGALAQGAIGITAEYARGTGYIMTNFGNSVIGLFERAIVDRP